jgi:hypothetical protein
MIGFSIEFVPDKEPFNDFSNLVCQHPIETHVPHQNVSRGRVSKVKAQWNKTKERQKDRKKERMK